MKRNEGEKTQNNLLKDVVCRYDDVSCFYLEKEEKEEENWMTSERTIRFIYW